MPSIIPQYQQQTRVSGSGGGISVPRDPQQERSGFEALGQGLFNLGTSLIQVKEKEAAADAALTLAQAQTKWQQEFITRQDSAEPGAPDFTGALLKDYDADVAKVIATGKTKNAKLYLTEGLSRNRVALGGDSIVWEAGQRLAHRRGQFEEGINLTATAAELDPAHYQERLAEQLAALELLDVSPAEKDALRRETTDMVRGRAAVGEARRNPDAAMVRLLNPAADDTLFRTLSPKARDAVLSEIESTQRTRLAAEDRVYRNLERAEKDTQDAASKAGDKRMAEGQLTSGWIEANRSRLSPDDYRYFYRSLSGEGGGGPRDVQTYIDLRERASGGQDVRPEARAALTRGSIGVDDYDRLLGEVESERPGYYKRGASYLSTISGYSDLNPTPDAARTKAAMLDDWDVWASQNPKAGDEDARKAYQRIGEEYSLIDRNAVIATMRAPRFLVGNRAQPDIDATEAATVKAFQNGELSPQEFAQQAELLKQWRRAVETNQKPQK